MAANPSKVATCEDYDSDASETVAESRKQANVAAKRKSQPSGPSIGKEQDKGKTRDRPGEKSHADISSDSGYSSRTAATLGSADSRQSAKSGSAPASKVDVEVYTSPVGRKQRPPVEVRQGSGSQSPKKAPARTPSQREKPRPRQGSVAECTRPDCPECRSGRPPPLEVPLDTSYPPFVPPHYPSHAPPPPHTYRYPPQYHQVVPIVQQPVPPRRRSSSNTRARPGSYHAGATPDAYWSQAGYGPSVEQPRGPPPALSAYTNPPLHTQSYPVLGATPPNATFLPPGGYPYQSSPTSSYEHYVRPPLSHYPTEPISARRPRPVSMFGPPIISYDLPQNPAPLPGPSARYPSSPHPLHIGNDDAESSEEDDRFHEDRDRALMPPPAQRPPRRPSLRRPAASDPYSPHATHPPNLPSPADHPDRRARTSSRSTSRTSSARRPSLTPKAPSHPNASDGSARITVEPSGSGGAARRRMSYMGHERRAELEARHRSLDPHRNHHHHHHDDREQSSAPRASRRRDGPTAAELDARGRAAEAYMQRASAAQPPPQQQQQQQQQAHPSTAPPPPPPPHRRRSSTARSEAGSARSSRASRASAGPDEFTIRFDRASGAVEVSGDMEGRCVSLRPAAGGEAAAVEVVVSGGWREAAYPSVGGSSRVGRGRAGR